MIAFAFFGLLSLAAVSHGWRCEEAPRLSGARQIDASLGHVVAANSYYAYLLNGKWWNNFRQYGLSYVTTGSTGTWALDKKKVLYKLVGGNFTKVPGSSIFTQLDAGGDGFLVASTGSRAYCLRSGFAKNFKGVGSVAWTALPAYKLKQFSCGLYGCWGVDTHGRVYHAKSIVASSCASTGWRYISAGAVMVEASNNGLVFMVSTNGQVFQRYGVYSGRTHGTTWRNVPMCMAMKHATYDLGKLWVLSKSGFVMRCKH